MLTNILQYLEQTVREVPDKLAFSTGKEGMDFATLHAHARTKRRLTKCQTNTFAFL